MNDDIFSDIDSETSGETSSDLSKIALGDISSVAISGNDWTVETVLNQIHKGNIELNPRFQRRDAWETRRKSLFIESLILGFPIPPIVLAEKPNERGKYIVLDGKQRLLSLRRFTSKPNDPDFKPFNLQNLEIRPDLNGFSYCDLREDVFTQKDVVAFDNQTIRTLVLRHWKSEDLLYHIFLRLNTGSKPLSPQELRQALHPGGFLDYAEDVATELQVVKDALGINSPDFRMRDVELIIRYLAFRNFMPIYHGNLKSFLDSACERLNKDWISWKPKVENQLQQLDAAHKIIIQSFGRDYRYSKWSGDSFEGRFNRAVFDVLVYPLLEDNTRNTISQNLGLYKSTFITLCERNIDFIDSVEKTTKSLPAVRARYGLWLQAVNNAYALTLSAPLP